MNLYQEMNLFKQRLELQLVKGGGFLNCFGFNAIIFDVSIWNLEEKNLIV
jgi:hypothetical protein